jgi:CubicO group peptidase (beta-lactamase class C family)
MNKSEKAPNASTLLKRHFAIIQDACKSPSLAYGCTFAGKRIAGVNSTLQFRIASMSKSFTAAAILLLRDRKMLQLDQPIGDVVPELSSLPLPTTDSPSITIRNLLTMSAGLATDDPWGDRHLDADNDYMQKLFANGGYFAEPVGTEFCYSNYGYAILGRAITNASKQPYQQFISSQLLEPLKMHSTTWTPVAHHATPHRLRDGHAVDEGLLPLGDGGFAAMGGLWSTVDDLLIWTNFLMNAFPARDGKDDEPLCRGSRREMQQIGRALKREKSPGIAQRILYGGYGMGLRIFDDTKLGFIVSHSGGLPGYGSNMMWYPDRQVALVSLANITYAPMFDANFLACEALQNEATLPPTRIQSTAALQSHAQSLVDLLNNWNDDKAHEIFADNVVLDEPYDRRMREFELTSDFGGPFQLGTMTAHNAAVASVVMLNGAGESALNLTFKLSPQVPPRIQTYDVKPITKQTVAK